MGGVLAAGLEGLRQTGVLDTDVQAVRELADNLLRLSKKSQVDRAIQRDERVLARREHLRSHDLMPLAWLANQTSRFRGDDQPTLSKPKDEAVNCLNGKPSVESYLEPMLLTQEQVESTGAVNDKISVPQFDLDEVVERLRADRAGTLLRYKRLRATFADARRLDGDTFAQLPPTKPAVSWIEDHTMTQIQRLGFVRIQAGLV